MNDRHPPGGTITPGPASDASAEHYAPYGTGEPVHGDLTTYATHDTTGFTTGGHGTGAFATDPLFGALAAQDTGGYGTGGGYGTPGVQDTAQWSTGGHRTLHHDGYAAQDHGAHDTGTYGTTGWTAAYAPADAASAQGAATGTTGQWETGQWETGAWTFPEPSGGPADNTQQWTWDTRTFDTGSLATGTFATGSLDTGTFATGTFATGPAVSGVFPADAFTPDAFASGTADTGAYDATQWNSDGGATTGATDPEPPGTRADGAPGETPAPDADAPGASPDGGGPATREDGLADTGELPAVADLLEEQEERGPRVPAPRTAASHGGSRSRRRRPAKRSALLTIAVPSACVMSVAGIAAASVGGLTGDEGAGTRAAAADDIDPDAQPVRPSTANNRLDTQLTSLAAGADDFADRASRTQERIDLKAEQVAEKKRAAEEAARKERLRPKFALPVAQHGLSAYYGQAGINWMSVHTGIDFPVSYGTPVMAATDGTVRTQFNSAYGNMLILTAKDGTETWYCHLSTYHVPSGTPVKAGDRIAYSGNSGNSTGPHLHFEVRPGGGAAIDPLAWLRSHGVDPS
ncbi:peptidoglycan DD-metalloendopeptidase family protein [Streptomyces sp. SID8352]|uniref:peptidoglycan DD-metalloendopeptidase family protein n=1 Tax=Streptomyces sp. SID8352 TaxID=2690338 RepID=UPI00136FE293|nr:peptidoglycan DD-metalloendopeptidase family protein [Streptomyces sp. SID8352]